MMPKSSPGQESILCQNSFADYESCGQRMETTKPQLEPVLFTARVHQFALDNTGLFLVILSQALVSSMCAAVKFLGSVEPSVSPLQLTLMRMGITYIFCLAFMLKAGIEDPIVGPKGVRLLLLFRGIGGFVAVFGVYFSLQYMSLSDVTVLGFLSPLTTAAAGALFLNECYHRSQALAGVVAFAGVILIARPSFLFASLHAFVGHTLVASVPVTLKDDASSEQRLLAVGALLLSVLGKTCAFTCIRAIGKRAHTLQIMNYFAMQGTLASAIGMVVTKTPFIVPARFDWLAVLFTVSVVSFIEQFAVTAGFKRETAGRASMGLYTQIVFATVFEFVFFHTLPSWLSVLGAVLILSSAVYVGMTR